MLGTLLYKIKTLRFLPHLYIFKTSKPQMKEVLQYESDKWIKINHINKSGVAGFMALLMQFPEYRSLYYHRTGKKFLRHFAKGQTNLYIHTPQHKIGKGLIIWHGYSTVINAQSIGEDVEIWHNVTLGKKTTNPIDDRPVIGNNVLISTGSIVLGNIKIADKTVIGAGTVVTKSIEHEGHTVIGAKQQIVGQ